MKRTLFFINALFVYISVFGQINLADSTVKVISYWNKGDTHTYKVIKTDLRSKNEAVIANDSTVFNIELSVIDSTATSYTVQALYKNYEVYKSNIKQELPEVTEGLKIVYNTNEYGEFQEVVNWEEVRDYSNTSLDIIIDAYKKNGIMTDDEIGKVKNLISATFSTKEAIETVIAVDIQQLHQFHGSVYKLGEEVEGEIELTNVYNPSEPFMADVYIALDTIYDDESYLLIYTHSIPKDQLLASVSVLMKNISKETGKDDSDLQEAVEKLDVDNSMIVNTEIHDSGWVIYSIQENTITLPDQKRIIKRTIELI